MTLAVIQARLGSTRLPRKALMDIGGRTMIQRVVGCVSRMRGLDGLVVCVPIGDLELIEHLDRDGVPVVTGPEHDVLARFVRAAGDAETLMRVSGDCPLWQPTIAEQVLALYHARLGCEYAWNVSPGYVDGTDCEIFSRDLLHWAHREAVTVSDREHVTPWMRRHVAVATLPAKPGITEQLKTSVDTLDDLERVRAMCRTS